MKRDFPDLLSARRQSSASRKVSTSRKPDHAKSIASSLAGDRDAALQHPMLRFFPGTAERAEDRPIAQCAEMTGFYMQSR